jgi:hypothetical protein
MNEDELKNALHGAMVASSPPPPMDSGAALDAAQRAHRRRKAAWGGAVAGLSVVAIAVGAVLVPQLTGGGPGLQVGGQGSSAEQGPSAERPRVTTASPTPPSELPSVTAVAPTGASDTREQWPDGQTDRTATSGPRADKSVRVLNDLGSSLPVGLEAVDKEPIGSDWYGPMRYTQSQFADYYDGDKQVWEYMGTTPVVQKGSPGVAKLWIQVNTKGNELSNIGSPCEAAEQAWPIRGGTCRVEVVDGKKIGLVTASGAQTDLEMLAIHKHEDGTVVFVGQASVFNRSGHPALGRQPFTQEQLLALAADPRFHLD